MTLARYFASILEMSERVPDRAQFNIYLPRELIRQVKHAAVDAGQSLSGYVEGVLRGHLNEGARS